MCDGNLSMANILEYNIDPIDILISKYNNAKRQQEDLKKETPLIYAAQHQLLDQNINIFNEIIEDLQKYSFGR
jgi:hypothetical protein